MLYGRPRGSWVLGSRHLWKGTRDVFDQSRDKQHLVVVRTDVGLLARLTGGAGGRGCERLQALGRQFVKVQLLAGFHSAVVRRGTVNSVEIAEKDGGLK